MDGHLRIGGGSDRPLAACRISPCIIRGTILAMHVESMWEDKIIITRVDSPSIQARELRHGLHDLTFLVPNKFSRGVESDLSRVESKQTQRAHDHRFSASKLMLYPCIPTLVVIEMIGQELDFFLLLLLLLLSCCALIGDLRVDNGNSS